MFAIWMQEMIWGGIDNELNFHLIRTSFLEAEMFEQNIQMHQHSKWIAKTIPESPNPVQIIIESIHSELWRKVEHFHRGRKASNWSLFKWATNYVTRTRFLLSNPSPSCVAKLCRLIEISCNLWFHRRQPQHRRLCSLWFPSNLTQSSREWIEDCAT